MVQIVVSDHFLVLSAILSKAQHQGQKTVCEQALSLQAIKLLREREHSDRPLISPGRTSRSCHARCQKEGMPGGLAHADRLCFARAQVEVLPRKSSIEPPRSAFAGLAYVGALSTPFAGLGLPPRSNSSALQGASSPHVVELAESRCSVMITDPQNLMMSSTSSTACSDQSTTSLLCAAAAQDCLPPSLC